MAIGDTYVFPGFLTPVLTQCFFQKPQTTFLTCFCRGEKRKYAGKKSRLNWGSNSQATGHESDTLTSSHRGGPRNSETQMDKDRGTDRQGQKTTNRDTVRWTARQKDR